MEDIEITFTRKFTSQDIDKIVNIALKEGISYWCGRYESVDGPISKGGKLILHDIDDDSEVWELDLAKLINGIRQVIEDYHWTGNMDDCTPEITDCIIQYALFFELYIW